MNQNKLNVLSISIVFITIAISLFNHKIIKYKILYNSNAYYSKNLGVIDGILSINILCFFYYFLVYA